MLERLDSIGLNTLYNHTILHPSKQYKKKYLQLSVISLEQLLFIISIIGCYMKLLC